MNIIYAVIIACSIVAMIINAPGDMIGAMISGAGEAVLLSISMVGIYAVWLALLSLMERVGLNKYIDKIMHPLTKRLFKGESTTAHEAAAMNMSANMLGMGGAATPLGIKTIENMKQRLDNKASDNMILFVVINCTSLQILPTTVIGLRAAAGSGDAGNIILPSLIASIISTVVGVALCYLCSWISKRWDMRKSRKAGKA